MPTDAERLDFLQRAAYNSRTGISLEWIPPADGEPSGYRYMRHHRIDAVKPTVREAIDYAIRLGDGS